eukprot:TRINITY_DN16196_c0_g1_i1.p1 TRINITY_DN16196_c0_g1~~TRINITY_DN16196_c0_g1_i1.p1  ORF type:complete len:411 (+),score=31.78 TRINITY_DN16196_c0_g1_i1:84-1235(+)
MGSGASQQARGSPRAGRARTRTGATRAATARSAQTLHALGRSFVSCTIAEPPLPRKADPASARTAELHPRSPTGPRAPGALTPSPPRHGSSLPGGARIRQIVSADSTFGMSSYASSMGYSAHSSGQTSSGSSTDPLPQSLALADGRPVPPSATCPSVRSTVQQQQWPAGLPPSRDAAFRRLVQRINHAEATAQWAAAEAAALRAELVGMLSQEPRAGTRSPPAPPASSQSPVVAPPVSPGVMSPLLLNDLRAANHSKRQGAVRPQLAARPNSSPVPQAHPLTTSPLTSGTQPSQSPGTAEISVGVTPTAPEDGERGSVRWTGGGRGENVGVHDDFDSPGLFTPEPVSEEEEDSRRHSAHNGGRRWRVILKQRRSRSRGSDPQQ